jgi:hypothetical protein
MFPMGREISTPVPYLTGMLARTSKETQQHDPCAVQEENLKWFDSSYWQAKQVNA